ncbi:hypothetical protein HF521_013861 [Silurus meridionalis]|uniref:Uncharacterized protein n=1 Tax=Silurus meridionalis TaxID=175797 RepID=A0A8T0A9S4_SILME|nr:hypothetical protein HF521_013861 [Silurus meridionalis]
MQDTNTNKTKRAASDMPPPSAAKKPRLDAEHTKQSLISSALKTLQDSCDDLLSPNWIDALLKGKCELPSLTDEEKSVISKFCVNEVSYYLLFYLVCIQFFSCGFEFSHFKSQSIIHWS